MKFSAGVLLFRRRDDSFEVLLGHMGGPFWEHKDAAAWSVPKGEVDDGEDQLATALREFEEELGHRVPDGPRVDLGAFEQSGRKTIRVWAVEGDLDPATIVSNTFEIEWPKGSRRLTAFPEVDRAAWFAPDTARAKLIRGQRQVIDRLETLLDDR